MYKNIGLGLLFVALVVSFGMRGNKECPKQTPRMEGGCVIQSTPTGEIKTCG
jgi:hypothetical protein